MEDLSLTVDLLGNMTIIALAGYALARLLVAERGPGDILVKFRRLLGITPELQDDVLEGDQSGLEALGVFGKMFMCQICATTAITLTAAVIFMLWPTIAFYAVPFATVGLALKILGY